MRIFRYLSSLSALALVAALSPGLGIAAESARVVQQPYVIPGTVLTSFGEPLGEEFWIFGGTVLCVVGGTCPGSVQSGETQMDIVVDDLVGDPVLAFYRLGGGGPPFNGGWICGSLTGIPVTAGQSVSVWVFNELPLDEVRCPDAGLATAGQVTVSFS